MLRMALPYLAVLLLASACSSLQAPSIRRAGNGLHCVNSSNTVADNASVIAGITGFCKSFAGYQFPPDTREAIVFGGDKIAPAGSSQDAVGVVIYKHATSQNASIMYPSCNFTLDACKCITLLTEAVTSCSGGEEVIKTSGSIVDPDCHWSWQFDLDLELSSAAGMVFTGGEGGNQVPSAAAAKRGDPFGQSGGCWDTGYKWNPDGLMAGLQNYCLGASTAGSFSEESYVWQDGKQVAWYDIQTLCDPISVTYDSCMSSMTPYITKCNGYGGWSGDQCITWTVDNDPQKHRPGEY